MLENIPQKPILETDDAEKIEKRNCFLKGNPYGKYIL